MQDILRDTLRRILMALVRCLLRNGMSYGEFDRIARKCYVDVAFRHFAPAGKKQTVSNVAILTGLNRKEVKKLAELDLGQATADNRQYNRVVRVLGGWINDSRYLLANGNPRDLDYEGEGSFSELVKSYRVKPIILTNGLALTPSLLHELRIAGAYGIVFHVIKLFDQQSEL